jgi:hypothetical protein
LALSLWASISGWLAQFDSAIVMSLGVIVPCGGYVLAFRLSSSFRRFVYGLDLRAVTLLQAGRIIGGAAFAISAWQGGMSIPFAVVTSATDLTIGVSAFFAAFVLLKRYPRLFHTWHLVGLLELWASVSLSILSSPGVHLIGAPLTSQAMTWLPFSLVATFLGPVVQILHLIALSASRKRPSQRR